MRVKAVILVGGSSRGTRFRPLSLYEGGTIKPLFPIAGKAMIGHHLHALSVLETPIEQVLVIGFYEEAQIVPYLQQESVSLKLNIKYISNF
jgi:mannose-1-phosphate guanylyltransferase